METIEKQLKLIGIAKLRVKIAINDYWTGEKTERKKNRMDVAINWLIRRKNQTCKLIMNY